MAALELGECLGHQFPSCRVLDGEASPAVARRPASIAVDKPADLDRQVGWILVAELASESVLSHAQRPLPGGPRNFVLRHVIPSAGGRLQVTCNGSAREVH